MTTTTASKSELLLELASPSLSPSLLQPLLHRLFSHPSIYNGFVPILELPSVRSALAHSSDAQRRAIVRTVQLFGYGCINDYHEALTSGNDAVMTLNDAQLDKLRMLTVISILKDRIIDDDGMNTDRRHKKKKLKVLSIPYSTLFAALHLPDENVRRLEDVLIQCIYNNLLCGKLDQCSKCLIVEPNRSLLVDDSAAAGTFAAANNNQVVCGSFLSRDIPSSQHHDDPSISKMMHTLESFLQHSQSLLTTLEKCTLANASIRKHEDIRWKEVNRMVAEGGASVKFGALERDMESSGGGMMGERDRSSKRSKMQGIMRGLI
jgi:hypothetical protein